MFRRIALISVLFILGCRLFAQSDANQIINQLSEQPADTTRVILLNELSSLLSDSLPDRSVFYARQALNLSNEIEYMRGIAMSNKNFGDIFNKQKKFQAAINYYLISIKLYDELELIARAAECYNKIGRIYQTQEKLQLALDNIYYALQISTEINDQDQIATANHNLGGIYYDQKEYDKAFEYYQNAARIREEINDRPELGATYNNLGEIYRLKGDNEAALDFYFRALELITEANRKDWQVVVFNNLGATYQSLKEFDKALDYYNMSLQLAREQDDKAGLATAYNSIGSYYLETADYPKGLDSYLRAYTIANEHALYNLQSIASMGISNIYESQRNFSLALQYYKEYASLNDTIFNEKKQKQISEIQARYENDLTEQQIVLQKNEIALLERNEKIYQLRYITLIGGLILFVIIGILVFGRQRYNNRKNKEIYEKNQQVVEARQALMESELKSKEEELVNFALHIVQKNDFLQKMKSEIKDIKSLCEKDKLSKINDLYYQINQNIRVNNEVEEFQQKVDKVNRDFINNLTEKFPGLTENEKRLSVLLRLNLSSKEIASLNNISTKAVEMGRYRLRKKLNVDSDTILTEFLQKL